MLADKLVELKLVDSISDADIMHRLKNELKPWLVKSWCIASKSSAQFAAKMEDVLAVYERPYNPKRPTVCVDQTHITLRDTPTTAIFF